METTIYAHEIAQYRRDQLTQTEGRAAYKAAITNADFTYYYLLKGALLLTVYVAIALPHLPAAFI
jgi:hypothetical protein